MNIFILDASPSICAEYHCDRHVIKMILEHAQMMCTTHHLHPNIDIDYNIPYKKTHENHPCTKWVRSSRQNYKWLYELTYYLNLEYKYRYGRKDNHKSWDAISSMPLPNIPDVGLTRWARAMPDECKISNNVLNEVTFEDVIDSYHNYYRMHKQHILKWTNREIPDFISEVL